MIQNEAHEDEFEVEPEAEAMSDDDISLEAEEISSAQKIKKFRDKAAACEQEKQRLHEELQRTKAEFLNARKRLETQRQSDTERITTKHLQELLPLCDSFQMAMSDTKAWEAVDATWRTGVESIHNQLQSILRANNVTSIDPTGEPFDPNQHEAIATEPVTDESQHNHIVSVVQRGYTRTRSAGEVELIRPARVTVGEISNK